MGAAPARGLAGSTYLMRTLPLCAQTFVRGVCVREEEGVFLLGCRGGGTMAYEKRGETRLPIQHSSNRPQGWAEGWMDGCTDGRMHAWMDAWMHGCIEEWMNEWMDE